MGSSSNGELSLRWPSSKIHIYLLQLGGLAQGQLMYCGAVCRPAWLLLQLHMRAVGRPQTASKTYALMRTTRNSTLLSSPLDASCRCRWSTKQCSTAFRHICSKLMAMVPSTEQPWLPGCLLPRMVLCGRVRHYAEHVQLLNSFKCTALCMTPRSAGSGYLFRLHRMHGKRVEHQLLDTCLIPTDACCSLPLSPASCLYRS